MIPNITHAVRKFSRLLSVAAVGLALLFLTLPTYAASPVAKGAEAQDATCPAGGQCFADVLPANPFYEFANRLYQQDLVSGYACGGPLEPCDANNRPYYRPGSAVTRQQMAKFIDNARRIPQIYIASTTHHNPVYAGSTAPGSIGIFGYGTNIGVQGQTSAPDGYAIYAGQASNDEIASGAAIRAEANTATGVNASSDTGVAIIGQSTNNAGVEGFSPNSWGVYGHSTGNDGVHGRSGSGPGVRGVSTSDDGVRGESFNGYGVYGTSDNSYAGYFQGDIYVSGNCTGCLGPSRIDDPTDPAHKYLYHSPVQSSEMLNLYTGRVTLDANGQAWVEMPSWFEPANTGFDYQLTCVGGYAPVYISQEINNNRFQIAGGKPGLKVSWQVTGTRNDPYSQQNRVPAQQEKPADEQGTYLHPELYTNK